MALDFDVPWLTHDQIKDKAEEFLNRYHPAKDIPIPIEEIVEFKLGLDIIPIPGLHEVLNVDGFTYGDRSAIAVEEFIYEKRLARYRFTLAHEAGHLILHPQAFDFFKPKTINEYKRYVQLLPDHLHGRMEFQANSFAGLVLVPTEPLKVESEDAIHKIIQLLPGQPLDPDFAWSVIEEMVSKRFLVSTGTVHRRIEKDRLRDKFPEFR